MKTPLSFRLLGLSTLFAFVISGCVVVGDSGSGSGSGNPPPSAGTLSIWSSIEGSTHPSECDYVGAVDLEVAVYEGSRLQTIATASCYDFGLALSLPDGDYNADVTLLDGYSAAVSTTLTLDGLRVISGTDLQIDIDFPTSSLLP